MIYQKNVLETFIRKMFTKNYTQTIFLFWKNYIIFQQLTSSISSICYIFSYKSKRKCYKVITFTEDENNFDFNIEKSQQHKKATFF